THDDSFRIWNPDWGGFPYFLQANNPLYVLYTFSLISVILVSILWFVDFKGLGRHRGIGIISRAGKYTLTMFVTHGIFALFPIQVHYWTFLVYYLTVTTGYLVGFYFWEKHAGGKVSLEWCVQKFVCWNPIQAA
ncbi:MAG: hypothetical protein ACTSU9_02455, partial [Promethearchaeota archaeon]